MQFLDNQKGAMNFSESVALKAVSLLLALILWITVLGFKKEEMRKNVKFEPLVAPGMMITNKIPSHIMFTLRGPRVLLNDVEKKLPPIRPDFRRSRDLTIPVAISEVLLGELPAGVSVVSYHPSNLLIRLEEVVERNVPVRPSLRGLPAQGYDISQVKVTPSKVMVSGPKSALEALEFITTEPVDTQELEGEKEVVVAVEVDPALGFRLSRENAVRVQVTAKPSRKKP
ncbi:MAG: YbbR-like domain-containing protein [Bdellovibrionota bacterium]